MSPGCTRVTIGLMLTVIHLITIPVDNSSANPARSLSTAVFQPGWALGQLWVFIIFPLAGGLLGGLVRKSLVPAEDA
jgi:aquaporin Z